MSKFSLDRVIHPRMSRLRGFAILRVFGPSRWFRGLGSPRRHEDTKNLQGLLMKDLLGEMTTWCGFLRFPNPSLFS